MLEDIEVVKANLHAYIDNGMFAALFLVGLVFIYYKMKDDDKPAYKLSIAHNKSCFFKVEKKIYKKRVFLLMICLIE